MAHRNFRFVQTAALIAALGALAFSTPCFAAGGMTEEDVPSTSVVPAEGPGGSAPSTSPSAGNPAPPAEGAMTPPPSSASKPRVRHVASNDHSMREPEIEPASARVKVLQDAPVYASPTKKSKRIEQMSSGKYIEVTGSTRYFLQVKLKNGQTGYIEPTTVEVARPTDQIFLLTRDAAVLEKPNRWSKKVSEVHKGRNVHVIGISLNYMQIRMKSGLEGFIPTTALE